MISIYIQIEIKIRNINVHGDNLLLVGDDASHERGAIVAAQAHKHHPTPPKNGVRITQ
jgi:hypothetical protein